MRQTPSSREPKKRDAGDAASAFVTVVSGKGVPAARVLARSLEEHHPSIRRFVVVVDRPIPLSAVEAAPFEVMSVEDLGIRDLDDFIVRYTAEEACRKVLPYVFRRLFERHGLAQVVYFDPEVLVASPLTEVFRAFERGSVVLVPRTREPFRDGWTPNEEALLRRGAFDLGFVGLRRGESATRLLAWWADRPGQGTPAGTRVAADDDRWMDLVPTYFDEATMLRDPGYGASYWNLHERPLRESLGEFTADGRPLAFFHFEGYDPRKPASLSAGQTRHDPRSLPVLRTLLDSYGTRLLAEGYEEAAQLPYGFAQLSNGVSVTTVVRAALVRIAESGVVHPSVRDADELCTFLMTPNAAVSGAEVSPFVRALLDLRPDLRAAYPMAETDAADPALHDWLETRVHETGSELLYERFKSSLARINPFDRIATLYAQREDLRAAYPDAFLTGAGLEAFGEWLISHGLREAALDAEDVVAFMDGGRTGFESVLEYYFASPELQGLFPLALLAGSTDFVAWLTRDGTRDGGLTMSQVRWFEARVRGIDPSVLLLLTALHNEWVRLQFPLGGTLFGWTELSAWARAMVESRGGVLRPFSPEPPLPLTLLHQLEVLHTAGAHASGHPGAMRSGVALREFADAAASAANPRRPLREREREEIATAAASYVRQAGVNLAGYFHYAAGVGTSVRSLARVLDAAGIEHEDVALPVPPGRMSVFEADPARIPPRFWARHRVDFDVAVTVVNADASPAARAYLGSTFTHCRQHVGYWVWETDCLPGRHAQAAEGLDAIWTPSEYSATAIRRTLGSSARVEVVPHAVVVPKAGTGERPPYLPSDRVLVGSFFDARSVLERKNPAALLRAFRAAFRADDPVSLVLKVNHASSAPRAMRELEELAEGLPVIWLRDVRLDDADTFDLLRHLHVYASLHRAEGFGLVLAEAMALGKPVVATGFSGNMDFMDAGSAALVRHREIVTDRAYGPYERGTRWAEPDVEHAAELLRALSLDAELRKALGDRARSRVEQQLSPIAVARTVVELLGWAPEPGPEPTYLEPSASSLH